MERSKKEALVAELHQTFADSNLVVVTHQAGLTVAEMSALRVRMRAVGASFKVTKNRLARIALAGTKFEGLADSFTGPTAVAVSSDPVAAAKVAVDYAGENEKLTIVAGSLGDEVFDADKIKALAKIPSLPELQSKIIGLIQAPASKLPGVLQSAAGKIPGVLHAYANKEKEAA